jgi:glycosyltransferase involved in cell wall biosynthesis
MLGFCNQTMMPQAYAAADVLVLPSDGRETWGLVANEALACGLPIVLSDAVGSSPDLAGDGLAGRIFPVSDVGALAHAIGGLVNSPPSSEAIAAKSAAYSLERAAEGIFDASAFIVGRRTSCNAQSA